MHIYVQTFHFFYLGLEVARDSMLLMFRFLKLTSAIVIEVREKTLQETIEAIAFDFCV